MYQTVIFDLDGTLTDSGEGIINCAILALEHFGLPIPSREEMRVFVGPPLDETFIKFGVPADQAQEAIRIYRTRYIPIGKFENRPYNGIRELLDFLDNNLPKDSFLLSLMSQYTPNENCKGFPEINRRVTTYEYRKVADRAAELGFSGFAQDRRSAKEEYTPPFDLEGV